MTTRIPTSEPTSIDYTRRIYRLIVAVLAIAVLSGAAVLMVANQQAKSDRMGECVREYVAGARSRPCRAGD
jgi:hypothetical protein